MLEKNVLEKLFDRGGYVLDFSNRTFSEFFRENGLNIDQEKYLRNGTSKMKRLRAFWEIEPDKLVGEMILALLEYGLAVGELTENDDFRNGLGIVERLTGKNTDTVREVKEDDFLNINFETLDLAKLNLDSQLSPVIAQRISEIQLALNSRASLSVVFLCGSTLEGLLQDLASKNAQAFNQAKSAPKDKENKVRAFHEWTLDALINVAHELLFISLDVKKFSHSLRDFRNFIHPREQALHRFNPDAHTAKICWQVLRAALADLSKER